MVFFIGMTIAIFLSKPVSRLFPADNIPADDILWVGLGYCGLQLERILKERSGTRSRDIARAPEVFVNSPVDARQNCDRVGDSGTMQSGAENQICLDNLKVLQKRMPAVLAALAVDDRSPLVKAVPYVNINGEINVSCVLTNGSQVALHDEENITKGAAGLMTNWKIKSGDNLVFHGFGIGYGPLAALRYLWPRTAHHHCREPAGDF